MPETPVTTSESYSAGSLHIVPLSPAPTFYTVSYSECHLEPFQQFLTTLQSERNGSVLQASQETGKFLLLAVLLMFDRLEDPSMWWWEMKVALRSLPTFQPLFHSVKLESACSPNACSHCTQLCRVLLCRHCIYVHFNKVTCIQKCVLLNEKFDVVTVRIILVIHKITVSLK